MSDTERLGEDAEQHVPVGGSMPAIPLMAPPPSGDLTRIAPMFGVMPRNSGPQFLDYNVKGRSWYERMFYNSGVVYLGGACRRACAGQAALALPTRLLTLRTHAHTRTCTHAHMHTRLGAADLCAPGIAAGGAYGAVAGWRKAPSPRFKIRLNTVLNSSGRNGARLGNALGCLAVMYSMIEAGMDYVEVERFVGSSDLATQVGAATLTGMLYKSTGAPRSSLAAAGAYRSPAPRYRIASGDFPGRCAGRRGHDCVAFWTAVLAAAPAVVVPVIVCSVRAAQHWWWWVCQISIYDCQWES